MQLGQFEAADKELNRALEYDYAPNEVVPSSDNLGSIKFRAWP